MAGCVCTLDAARVQCWVGRSVGCVQLCVGSWGLAAGGVLFLESGHQGRCSQGLRAGGMDGGGPVRGDTRGGGQGVHMCTRCQRTSPLCVHVCSLCICAGGQSGVSRCYASVSLCLCCVCVLCARAAAALRVCVCVCACACVCVRACVWILSLQHRRPSPGLPSKGPRSLSSAALEQGCRASARTPLHKATN